MKTFLEAYESVSVIKVLEEDTWSMALVKGAFNGVPIMLVVGGVGHVLETLYRQRQSKK